MNYEQDNNIKTFSGFWFFHEKAPPQQYYSFWAISKKLLFCLKFASSMEHMHAIVHFFMKMQLPEPFLFCKKNLAFSLPSGQTISSPCPTTTLTLLVWPSVNAFCATLELKSFQQCQTAPHVSFLGVWKMSFPSMCNISVLGQAFHSCFPKSLIQCLDSSAATPHPWKLSSTGGWRVVCALLPNPLCRHPQSTSGDLLW